MDEAMQQEALPAVWSVDTRVVREGISACKLVERVGKEEEEGGAWIEVNRGGVEGCQHGVDGDDRATFCVSGQGVSKLRMNGGKGWGFLFCLASREKNEKEKSEE